MVPIGLIDSHCHLDQAPFATDLREVIAACQAEGIDGFILAGVEPAGWLRQRSLARTYPVLRYSVGVHPWALGRLDLDVSGVLERMARYLHEEPRPVAVGEIGLDKARRGLAPMSEQRVWLEAQLSWARRQSLPVILHVVRAHGAALEHLTAEGLPEPGGVVHGFHGSWETARSYLDMDLHLGFNGGLLRYGGPKMRKVIESMPLNRLLLESDSPDQHPTDSSQRNEPTSILTVAKVVAEIRQTDPRDVLKQASENARLLFGLDSASLKS